MNRVVETLKSLKIKDCFIEKCLFYLFKINGVAPISLNVEALHNTNEKQYTFTHSLKNIAYNLFIIVFLIVSNSLSIYGYFYMIHGNNEPIYHISDMFGFFGATYIIGSFCLKYKGQIGTWNKINEIRNSIRNNWRGKGSGSLRKIKVAIWMFALNWLGLTISVSLYSLNYALFNLSLNICHLVITSVALQYCVVVETIKQLFVSLNANLANYSKHIDCPHGFAPVLKIHDELSRLWGLYAELNKLSRDVSSFYSMSMLLITVNAFSIPTSVIYVIIAKPMVTGSTHYLTINDYVSGTLFTLIYLTSIVLLTSSVSATVVESKKIREIVSAQLRKAQSRVIREKLHQFSIYLLYEVVEFTVFDFFSLNSSLLVSIVGIATTYLVILLQFQGKNCVPQNSTSNFSSVGLFNATLYQIFPTQD